jgi:NADH-quinone oxidoreductase subunit N
MLILAQNLSMAAKLNTLWPEILLTAVAFTVMILGLSKSPVVRRATFWITMGGLAIAACIAGAGIGQVTALAQFTKVAIALIGIALVAVAADLPDESGTEPVARAGKPFDPAVTTRGEFFGFFLLSLVGAMLCAGADDLIWLFLALELTSLPTYVLVAVSRQSIRAPEAGVKYFFLGAFAAAMFLYGFALIYTATGSTYLSDIHQIVSQHGLSNMALLGVLLSVLGIAFKIAAFPMHFYAADVYEGAATPVSTFLAFVPKAAGFISLILILQAIGWGDSQNHQALEMVLWLMAVATMFIGNTLALLQNNVKRVLAYSSIAHTGYMLVGLLVGPGYATGTGPVWLSDGVAAVLFYLIAYGVMNLGAFAVLGILRRSGEEAETFEDLRGLAHRRPGLAAVMAVCVLSLTGIPPLVGFFGKVFLIGAAISAGFYLLAALTVLNSAISAWYYLHMFGVCFLHEPADKTESAPSPARSWAAIASALGVIVLSIFVANLFTASHAAATLPPPARSAQVTESIPHPATGLVNQ